MAFKATIVAMNKFMKLLKQPNLGPDVWINPSLVASAYEVNPKRNTEARGLLPEVKLVPLSLRPPLAASIVLATFDVFPMKNTEKDRLDRIQVNSGMVVALKSESDSTTTIYLIDDTTCTLEEKPTDHVDGTIQYKVDGTIEAVEKKLGIELEVSTKA